MPDEMSVSFMGPHSPSQQQRIAALSGRDETDHVLDLSAQHIQVHAIIGKLVETEPVVSELARRFYVVAVDALMDLTQCHGAAQATPQAQADIARGQ